MNDRVVICPYCGGRAELVDSREIYGRSYGMAWLCAPCDAYVGCHKTSPTYAPLGTLARAGLRALRREVHAALDPIWRKGLSLDAANKDARRRTYSWLASQLEIEVKRCHVGEFNEDMCERALRVLDGVSWATVSEASPPTRVLVPGDRVVVARAGESRSGVVQSPPLFNARGAFYVVRLEDDPDRDLSVADYDLSDPPIIDSIADLANE